MSCAAMHGQLHRLLLPFTLVCLLIGGCGSTSHRPGTTSALSTAVSAVSKSKHRVDFKSLDSITSLQAIFRTPSGSGPFPAIVMLHGCSGTGRNGRLSSRHRAWMDHMLAEGFAVLLIDSATPRGVSTTCHGGEARKTMYRDRPKDAYAGLLYLQQQGNIDPEAIVLMGWSQGGGITLLTVESSSIGRPAPVPPQDFKAAVAFYPGACSSKRQSAPFTKVPRGQWQTRIPLLVLHGSDDNWTRPGPCQRFIEAAQSRQQPVQFILYKGARHSFDYPNLKNRTLTRIRLRNGKHPTVGTHPLARDDALKRVPAFFRQHIKSR
jgi:dienelactone hydrolase